MRNYAQKTLNLLKGGATNHNRFFKKVICGTLATLCLLSSTMITTYASTPNSQPEEKYYFIMKVDQNGSYIYEMITETEYNIYIQNLNK